MSKWSFVAVSAALAVTGVGASVSAEAHPYLTVGVDVPAVAVVGPLGHTPVYCGPFCYEHGRYWRRDYDRYRFDRFPRERSSRPRQARDHRGRRRNGRDRASAG